jgi:hypothetical protein
MKRALLPILLAFPLIHVGGCSAEDNPITVPGGAGTPAGMAGTPAGGGMPGASGSAPVAGTGPSAGTGPTAGSGTGGASGGTGMGGSSSGGVATGGTGGGAGGAVGGMAGSGTGGTAVAVSLGKLDGMLLMTPCGGDTTSDDCPGSMLYEGKSYGCVGGKLDSDTNPTLLDFAVTGGEVGKRYIATLHFYGVMEPKAYGPNATREAGTMRPSQTAIPAKPDPYATANGTATVDTTEYNNWEVHTFDDKGVKLKQHFLNSDTNQGHYTLAISYARDIEVVGGGRVHVRTYDSNCRMIKNCLGGAPCAGKGRTVPITGADPMPRETFLQPGLGKDGAQSGQWLFIDVKGIVPKP